MVKQLWGFGWRDPARAESVESAQRPARDRSAHLFCRLGRARAALRAESVDIPAANPND